MNPNYLGSKVLAAVLLCYKMIVMKSGCGKTLKYLRNNVLILKYVSIKLTTLLALQMVGYLEFSNIIYLLYVINILLP